MWNHVLHTGSFCHGDAFDTKASFNKYIDVINIGETCLVDSSIAPVEYDDNYIASSTKNRLRIALESLFINTGNDSRG